MPLSTSSSEAGRGTPPGRVAAALWSGAAPTVLALALMLAAAELWYRAAPALGPVDPDSVLLATQQERARTMGPADLVVLGDSSALMGIDAPRLGAALGDARIESLATMGIVGPVGHGALLRAYAARGNQPANVLLLLHGASLVLTDPTFAALGYEAMAVAGRMARPSPPLLGARRKLFQDLVFPVVSFPLLGAFGRAYGWPADMKAALIAGRGTMIDPNPSLPARPAAPAAPYVFSLSDDVARRLDTLRGTFAELGVGRVLLGLTPLPDSRHGAATAASRAATLRAVAGRLGLADGDILDLPASLPDHLFASETHLSADGRQAYLPHLSAALADAVGRPTE